MDMVGQRARFYAVKVLFCNLGRKFQIHSRHFNLLQKIKFHFNFPMKINLFSPIKQQGNQCPDDAAVIFSLEQTICSCQHDNNLKLHLYNLKHPSKRVSELNSESTCPFPKCLLGFLMHRNDVSSTLLPTQKSFQKLGHMLH